MFEAFIQAARATKVAKVTSLSEAYTPGQPFSVFINPVSDDDMGKAITITAKPTRNDSAVEVPVAVGDWSPVMFDSISANGVDLTNNELFVALIDIE